MNANTTLEDRPGWLVGGLGSWAGLHPAQVQPVPPVEAGMALSAPRNG